MSKPARRLVTGNFENTPQGQSPGTKRRPARSRFRGVVTTPSYSTADIRSFFDQCASTGSPEAHGHPQRLLDIVRARLDVVSPLYSSCAAVVEDGGHRFGESLPEPDKRALIAFLATL